MYAFIPREAISKFLLYCVDCQRKNALDPNSTSTSRSNGSNGSNNGNGRTKTSKLQNISTGTNISQGNKIISSSTSNNNISISNKKPVYPPNLSIIPNPAPTPFNNTLSNLLTNTPQLINGNSQLEMSNGNASVSPIGGIGNLPGINQPSPPSAPVLPTPSTTAAQAVALSQAVAAMQSLAAGGVQHPLRSLQSPLIQARLAAGAANFVANNPLNSTNSLLVSLIRIGKHRFSIHNYIIHNWLFLKHAN